MSQTPVLPGIDLLRAVLPDAPLSVFTIVREIHYRTAEDGAELLLRLATQNQQPPIEIVMTFLGVVDFYANGLGGPFPQVMRFSVGNIRDREWESVAWEVRDYENGCLQFWARDAAIIECGPA